MLVLVLLVLVIVMQAFLIKMELDMQRDMTLIWKVSIKY